DQPEQPVEEPAPAQDAGSDHPERKTNVAGGGGRPVGQWPSWPGGDRSRQPPAEVAQRHAQGQEWTLSAEPFGQTSRLLRALGDCDRSGAETEPVRSAQKDGLSFV